MNNPIGIIDSGVGGLSIASKLIQNLPSESFIYLADSKNCPYGSRSKEEIFKLSEKMIDFLINKNIKLLVIACNTITVTNIDNLRDKYLNLPIAGTVPVIKTAVKETKNKKIGIFSTKATAESNYQEKLINDFAKGVGVINIGSSDLVSLIEKLDFKVIDKILNNELVPFKSLDIDVLALGCTHFPLIKDKIKKFLPKVLILDSSEAIVRQVRRILENNSLLSNNKNPSYNFYTTGETFAMEYFVKKLTIKAKIEKISI